MEKTNQPILLGRSGHSYRIDKTWTHHERHSAFRPRRFEGGGMRYLRFERWLNETRDVSGDQRSLFRRSRRHLGVDAAHAYGGFLASLTAWCEEHSIPYEGVPVGTIKFITGKDDTGKQAVIAAVSP